MSVATKNPFAILSEDDGSTTSAPPSAPTSGKTPASTAPTRGTSNRGRGSGGPASRGGKYYSRGGGAPTQNRVAKEGEEAANANASERPRRNFDGEGRGRGRGRGGPRGGRGRGRGGKDERLDRHSATGKTDSEKKVHQGWGGDEGERELQAEEAATTDAANAWGVEATESTPAEDPWAISTAAESGAPPAEGDSAPKREEEEDNTLTLDQYMAKKEEVSLVPKLEPRKANEGDEDLFKNAVPVQKDEEQAYFALKTKSAHKAKAKKEEKIFIEIDGRFDRPDRGRGRGRGGDRGVRGGRGRGGGRGRANGQTEVNVADETAFPSLS